MCERGSKSDSVTAVLSAGMDAVSSKLVKGCQKDLIKVIQFIILYDLGLVFYQILKKCLLTSKEPGEGFKNCLIVFLWYFVDKTSSDNPEVVFLTDM